VPARGKFLLGRSPFGRFLKLAHTRRGLSHLRALGNPVTDQVGHALEDVLEGRLGDEERMWIETIESLRARCASSSSKISFVDYGAISAERRLSADAMEAGQPVTRTLSAVSKGASSYPAKVLVLFKLVRELRPSSCLELGTHLGISTAYQAAALELNDSGALVSLEGAETLAQIARAHLRELGLDRAHVEIGRFQDTLRAALRQCGSVDFAYVDGHHDEQATINYFREILPFFSEGGVLVVDDIRWSEGMRAAWKAIRSNEGVRGGIDLGSAGLCVIGSGTREPMIALPFFPAAVTQHYAAH
jgi:predicted O-methyltransferase YrrM